LNLQVTALEAHQQPALDVMELVLQEMETPVSSVDADHVAEFIHQQKELLKHADVDLKDAKRRISAFKGPNKRKGRSANNADDVSGSEDGSISA